VVFLILHLTGDPAALLLPPDASSADLAAFRHAEGFDRPLWQQYLSFAGGLLHGDFGQSLRYHQPAIRLVLERVPATRRAGADRACDRAPGRIPGRGSGGGEAGYRAGTRSS